MPSNLETFTTCAGPGTARPHTQLGGLAGAIISAWYASGVLTIIGGLAYLAALIFVLPPFMWCVTAAAIVYALSEIKDWYYNERLLCIRDPECAIGTVISEPTAAFDGDRKLNLMLAPFSQLEIRLALMEHLERNRAMLLDAINFTDGFHPGGRPNLPSAAVLAGDPSQLQTYLRALSGTDPLDEGRESAMYNQIVIGLVDTLLLNSNVNSAGRPKNFFARFWRSDPSFIPDAATLAAIPCDQDTINWQAANAQSPRTCPNPYTERTERLNPMFRFDNTATVPYLHCELEGNYVEILLEGFIVALSVFTAFCIFGGPIIGAVAGFLAWLLKLLIDWLTGNDGDASEPDINWDDPDFTGYPGVPETTGDVIVAHGNMIMDTEHHQYFEIHPVRAYYLIAKNELAEDTPVILDGNEDQNVVGPNFDPTLVDAELADEICRIVNGAEGGDAGDVILRSSGTLLSWGMTARYAGG